MTMTFVQGDTKPDVLGALTYTDTGEPVDLTDADVVFQMRKADDRRYTVNAVATIVGPGTAGNVRYSWGSNDLAVYGDYQAQWQVTFSDDSIQTSEPPVAVTVRRQ